MLLDLIEMIWLMISGMAKHILPKEMRDRKPSELGVIEKFFYYLGMVILISLTLIVAVCIVLGLDWVTFKILRLV